MNKSSNNRNSPTTVPEKPSGNPLTAARERFQTSARELVRTLEDVHRRPTLREGAASIEQAFRVMFRSCTGGETQEDEPEDLQLQTITPIKDSVVSQKNIVTPPTVSIDPSPRSRRTSNISSSQHRGEDIYAQLFRDDAGRVAEAQRTPEPRLLSKPFPLSTPRRSSSAPSQELHVPASLTFDDAISAISAHTLEAMVDPPRPAWHPSEPLVRIRSSGNDSRFSLPSKGNNSRQSKTTHTTESTGSSFDVWQAHEQKFWDDMVHQDRHPHDSFPTVFDENPFIQPIIVREDISYLAPGTEEDYVHADMGEI
ncbi:hypothetical protein FisN_10Lh297 [Fistulifera solaris]|uniref:Uncharacterized protein n=1 Tax=Fistulifera solaris TaxID=1519565 RepID=A0A1Z5KFV6_FISSO|nr:hypothetical protein FisN_10Lh297 [Fistulifera solaris]|eukprot:GAX25097.1 hypothetical protein FisN_10Lh297 [Fistulifera solaris]